MSQCCLSGFQWSAEPSGKEEKLEAVSTYTAGSNRDAAIIIVHDIFGWTFPNARLLADHFAEEANATVYLPDFFEGEIVSEDMLLDPEKSKTFDLKAFIGRHGKGTFPTISGCVRALKEKHGFKKVGAIGYCWGGWVVFQLGGLEGNVVDCISTAHPSIFTREEIGAVKVPVQILAPEHDTQLTPELRDYCNKTIPSLNLEYDYQYFPGLSHGFAVRADLNDEAQKKGLERAKNAAVYWFSTRLH
ncbi:MAG: hypothetical protein Q9167_004225 [Letrouitia subvulpina]